MAPAGPGEEQRLFGPGVAGIGTASLLAEVGPEVPTVRLPSLLASTLRAPAAALGVIGASLVARGGNCDCVSSTRQVIRTVD